MTFPATRHSLIRRLTIGGTQDDWHQFLDDYWQPVCRFAGRWGRLQFEDAEDVGAATFQVLINGQLLQRWLQQPTAKLRTMLCSIVRNVLSNRQRMQTGRQRLLRENHALLQQLMATSLTGEDPQAAASEDIFYAAWAEELVSNTLRELHQELLQAGKSDQFRVFYGRVCEGMSIIEVSECLRLSASSVENYFRRSKQRLADRMQLATRQHVSRYCPADDMESEFQLEWHRLSEFLSQHGGLDGILRQVFESESGLNLRPRGSVIKQSVLMQLRDEPPREQAATGEVD